MKKKLDPMFKKLVFGTSALAIAVMLIYRIFIRSSDKEQEFYVVGEYED